MMKKIRIFMILFILSFSFSVKAEVLFELDCDNKNITANDSVTCEGWLSYEGIEINDIEMEYETNLNVDFKVSPDFMITNNNNKLLIHTDEALYDEIMNSTKIFDVIVSINDTNVEKEELILKNIIINNNSSEKIEDIKESFNVTLADKPIELDNNCYLDSILIDNVLVNNFNKETLEYFDITTDKEKIFIDAVRSSNKSSATGLGEVIVNKGESIVKDITVTAENGDIKVYKLHITSSLPKEIIKSSNNSLKSIELFNNGDKLDFNYDNTKNSFNIKVDGDIENIDIKAELDDETSSFVDKYNPRKITLKYGNNKVLLKVKAEDDSIKTYTLNINREDNRSHDNTLFYLYVNNHEIVLADEVYKYEVVVPHDVVKTKIKAMPNSEKAIVKYEDIILADGENNVSISITAEDGKEREYEINVVRENEPIKEEIVLSNIEITGYNINFSKDTHEYTLKIDKDTDELEIKVIPDNIDFEVINNKKLHDGNTVLIKVNDSKGLHEYKINIEKDSVINNVICYGVFGIGLVSFILSIIYFKSRKNK